MSLLDGLVKAGISKVLGGGSGNQGLQSQIVELLLQQVLGKQQQEGGVGGLGNLVDMFQNNGLGDVVNSWVGSGQNMQIDAEQVKQGLDSGLLSKLAQQVGVSENETASELGQILPDLIDKLTPQGQADNSLGLDDAVGILGQLLK